MHLDDHVNLVHEQLRSAAALGDERTQQIAETLATTADSAVRLAIMGALSAAASEITAALLDAPGAPSVTVQMDGDEVRVAVSSLADEPAAAPPRADDGDASARISLRLSESLKNDIDEAAEREGVSVNTWIVRAASAALSGRPGPGQWGRQWGGWTPGGPQRGPGANRITGWVTG